MRTTAINSGLPLLPRASFLLVALLTVLAANDARGRLFGLPATSSRSTQAAAVRRWAVVSRGGATLSNDDEDEYDSEEDESDEENEEYQAAIEDLEDSDDDDDEEEEEEEDDDVIDLDASLAASTMRAASKAKAKSTETSKAHINAKLAETKAPKPKKTLSNPLKFLGVPYIIRACLNPFTVVKMTRGYFASLFSLDYPPKDQTEDLRSGLQAKSKGNKGGGSSSGDRKGKRKMRPGQAKTLSDLPQLNT